MQGVVNIAIIGAGFGQQVHVPAFRNLAGCRIHSICARNLDRAQQAAQSLGIPKATNDWHHLVNDPDVQAIALAVPPSLQAEIALAAARTGKHIFCEKPLALGVGQAQKIVEAANKSGIVHAIDFIFAEIPAWQKARELLQSSAVGNIRQVALTWRTETYTYRSKSQNWKTASVEGGGTLNNFASHSLYYLEWLFGPIEKAKAYLSPAAESVEARVDAWLEFAAGFPATVSISADAFLGAGHRLEVYGESGTLVLDNTTSDYARGFRLSLGDRQAGKLLPVEVPFEDTNKDGRIYPVSQIAGRFIRAIHEGGNVTPNLAHGLRVQTLIDTLRLAHRNAPWQSVSFG
jgi:predicted dehydrogenase